MKKGNRDDIESKVLNIGAVPNLNNLQGPVSFQYTR